MAGASLDEIIVLFNSRITELQELVIARNIYPKSSISELSAVDASLMALEQQVQAIRCHLQDEIEAIPKAKKLIDASLRQRKKLQTLPVPQSSLHLGRNLEALDNNSTKINNVSVDPIPEQKENKNRNSPPVWYVTAEEIESLSAYMRGRLTVEKVNSAINDMVAYAEANSQLLTAPKNKLAENQWEKALEVRDVVAVAEGVKGKHFFLETDIKGPNFRLDNTGKAIVTVLRHLGRLTETRSRHHRIFVLLKPN